MAPWPRAMLARLLELYRPTGMSPVNHRRFPVGRLKQADSLRPNVSLAVTIRSCHVCLWPVTTDTYHLGSINRQDQTACCRRHALLIRHHGTVAIFERRGMNREFASWPHDPSGTNVLGVHLFTFADPCGMFALLP